MTHLVLYCLVDIILNFLLDPSIIKNVTTYPTNRNVTVAFTPGKGIVDFYNVTVAGADDLDTVLDYVIATPSGTAIFTYKCPGDTRQKKPDRYEDLRFKN